MCTSLLYFSEHDVAKRGHRNVILIKIVRYAISSMFGYGLLPVTLLAAVGVVFTLSASLIGWTFPNLQVVSFVSSQSAGQH